MADEFADLIPNQAGGGGDEFADLVPRQSPSVGQDVARSMWAAPVKAGISLAGLPEQVAGWGAQGLGWLTGRDPESFRDQGANRLPSAADIRAYGEAKNGPLYEPQTPQGKIAGTATEWASMGPRIVPKLVGAGLGAISELGGMATEGTAAEPYVRAAPALAPLAMARRAGTLAAPAMQAEKIEQQGTNVYNAVRGEMNQYKGTVIDGKTIAAKARGAIEDRFSDISAPKTHELVDRLAKARTTTEMLDLREALGPSRLSGKDGEAAGLVRSVVNRELDDLIPGTSERLGTADKNYAIAKAAKETEGKTRGAVETGTLSPATFKAEAKAAIAERPAYMSDAEYNALRKAARPMPLRKGLSYLDPITHPWLAGLLHAPAAIMTGGLSLPASAAMGVGLGAQGLYRRGMRQRAEALSEAIRSQAPASINQPGIHDWSSAYPAPLYGALATSPANDYIYGR